LVPSGTRYGTMVSDLLVLLDLQRATDTEYSFADKLSS
jgi:hypothetical protein